MIDLNGLYRSFIDQRVHDRSINSGVHLSFLADSNQPTGKQFGRGLRTLIVEDDPPHAALSAYILNDDDRIGAVDVVTDGEEAVEKLQGGTTYQLILVDLRMPRMDGLMFLSWAREQDYLSKVVIAVLTTSARTDEHQESLEKGADAFLTKPLDNSHIDGLIQIHKEKTSGHHV